MNRELFGPPLEALWALYVPSSSSNNPTVYNSEYYHPAYLYEQLLNLLLFAVNLFLFKKFKLKGNLYIISWLTGYGLIRFIVEFYRIGTTLSIGITFSQIVSLAMVIAGLAMLIYNNLERWKTK
jgi:phosphatidylglycerol:prolipoprotein diacylglycerol transferase